jgi:hypothetical protein
MLDKEPAPDRANWGFMETVLNNFRFLEDSGFQPVERSITFIRYESPRIFVNIYHGRTSFEMGVEIGRLREPNGKVTVNELIYSAGAEKKPEGFDSHVMFQVTSRQGVEKFVPQLANLVKKYGPPFLCDDDTAYRSLRKAHVLATKTYEKEIKLRHIREKAEVAWRTKNYKKIVELFEPVRGDLTNIEAKKLAYSKKKVAGLNDDSSKSSIGKTLRRFKDKLKKKGCP